MYLIAGIAMACSVLLTVSDVILRLFRRPILGTYELVGILAGLMIGFALPQTSRTGGHVVMDLLSGRLPPGLSKVFHVFSRVLGILFFAMVSWYLVVMGNDFLASGESSTTLQIPLYPVAYALASACLVECLVLFVSIFEEKETE
jgi:TRAP-type C4-dicarboxylate transport system permease small subunit